MSKAWLTEAVVLRAVTTAVRPQSVYINNEIQRQHRRYVAGGGEGHCPSSSLVLRRLRSLAAKGYLVESRFADGLYGYTWAITDPGRAAAGAA